MSLYVLDTDIVTLFGRGDPNVSRQILAHAADELAVAVITAQEVVEGWLKYIQRRTQPKQVARGYEELATSIALLAGFTILAYRESTMTLFDHLWALKLNVRAMDLRIAAIVLENNAILVTRNLRDFQRIPNLATENWAA